MKKTVSVSIFLNLLLLAAIFLIWRSRTGGRMAPGTETKPAGQTIVAMVPKQAAGESKPFCWSQLDAGNDYRAYIANLRAIGCPESTIGDIVGGNVARAFAWKRTQLRIDDSGTGPWSRISEQALVDNLLGRQPSAAAAATVNAGEATTPSGTGATADAASASSEEPTYPLFLSEKVNWSQMGFDAGEQAAIAHARQQFLSDVNVPESGSGSAAQPNEGNTGSSANDPGYIQRWQNALQTANDNLQMELGNQDFATYEMQQYYAWFQPQAVANKNGGNLNVNLADYVPH